MTFKVSQGSSGAYRQIRLLLNMCREASLRYNLVGIDGLMCSCILSRCQSACNSNWACVWPRMHVRISGQPEICRMRRGHHATDQSHL